MDRKYWLIAAAIVLGALAMLAYQPADRRVRATDDSRAPAIVDLPAVDAPAVATVELAARDGADSATMLTTRFEQERRDAAWAERAAAEVERSLAAVLGENASIDRLECRTTVCRLELRVGTPAARPETVAAVIAALQRAGHETLLERADGTAATLVIGVRTPQTP